MSDDFRKYTIKPNTTVVQAMQRIDAGAKGVVFVVDDNDTLIGCVTDGDIRRWIIKTADLEAEVTKFMSSSPKMLLQSEVGKEAKFLNKYSINAVPIVDNNYRIVSIYFRDFTKKEVVITNNQQLKGIPVVIMAGGKGTRLYPYTMVMPKPLIPVGEVTVIERIIMRFLEYGVDTFYLSVNYKKSMIKAYFEELNLPCTIKYIEEDKPLGTGGSLKLIDETPVKPFIVTNCDILIDTNLSELYKQHIESGNPMTIVAALKSFIVPYGVLKVRKECVIEEMQEKPTHSYFVNTGMYVVNPQLLEMIPDDTFFHMTHLAQRCMDCGLKVGVYPISEESFLDMGEFEELKRMEEKL